MKFKMDGKKVEAYFPITVKGGGWAVSVRQKRNSGFEIRLDIGGRIGYKMMHSNLHDLKEWFQVALDDREEFIEEANPVQGVTLLDMEDVQDD